jgi:inner membrane transporter RhtA
MPTETHAAPAGGNAPAVVSLIVAMLSFQAGASIAKGLIQSLGAPGTTALRLGVSVIILCAIQRPWRTVPSRKAARVILVYGLSLGTMNLVFYSALGLIPLGIAVGLEFTGPLAVAVWASRRPIDYLWLVLAVAGVLCLLPLGGSSQRVNPLGVAFALAAGACWALYIVFGQRAGRLHGASATTWGMLVAAALIVPIGLADAGVALASPDIWPRGIAVAILSSAFPYTLEMTALRRLSAGAYGTLMSLEPAMAALAGLVLLREHLTVIEWLGIAAVMVASIGTLGHEQPST